MINKKYRAKGLRTVALLRFCSTALIIASLLFSQTVWALPQDGTVVGGSSTISQPNATTMQINQTTDKSIINWQGYSIGANEKVQYNQPNSGSISLNRVVGQDPSLIYGQLSANGQVWVINPNGLLIGNGASINVGSFLGSTLNINDNDFMNGNYKFINTTGSLSSITNQGNINAADGGYVVLISPSITNEGNITTNSGKTYLASGDEVTLNFAGNDLIGFTIDKAAAETLLNSPFDKGGQGGILNKGTIIADGGQVILSAKVAGDLLKTVINNEGVIQAQTIEDISGKIYLLGGMDSASSNTIQVGGTLDASAPNGGDGGFIETSAAKVNIADDAKITTAASNGKTGTWLIDPTDYNIAASGGNITGATLSTNLGSNNVTILSSSGATGTNGDVNVKDAVSWSANTTLTLSAYRNVNVNSNITATGNTAGLTLTPNNTGAGGSYSLNGAVITLSGSAPSLTIAGNAYTVINFATALQNMNTGLAGKYALGSDIDATATSGWNAGAGFAPVGSLATQFTGQFDGLGHTVTGLTINRPTTDYVGLFGYINGATIRNVGLVGGSVTGGISVGGLAGYNNLGTITNSYSTGTVSGNSSIGGLVGSNAGTITNSYSTGSVSGGAWEAGGLAGGNRGTISNSYATGSVYGRLSAGGLVGFNAGWGSAPITNSYSTGRVTGGNEVGGLVGYNDFAGTITNSYWDTQTSGRAGCTAGSGSAGCTGLTTTQMMAQANFTGFDFTNTWWMSEGNTRPFLRSEYSANITNAHQLQLMGMNLSASYTLAKDIDLSGSLAAVGGQYPGMWGAAGFAPVGNSAAKFTGTFDGLNHTISNLLINRPGTSYVGLFGYADTGSAISNVGLVNANVTGGVFVGALIGENWTGASVNNAYSTGSIVSVASSPNSIVGGLVGRNTGAISNSYSTASATGNYDNAGGLVGINSIDTSPGTITNSYSTGAASGRWNVGGLAGTNYGTITNSYSTGIPTQTGANLGGLVGNSIGGTVNNSYWDTATSGLGTSQGGTGLTAAQMKTQSSFNTWDFSNTWIVYNGFTYPLIRSFMTPLTVTANNATKTYNGLAYSGGSGLTYSSTPNGNLLGTASYSGTSQGATNAGSYAITPGGLYSNQQGYDIAYVNGALTVNPAALTVTANADSKTYNGLAYSGGNGVGYSGFVNSETSAVLGGTLGYSGTSQGATNTGSYTITPGGQTSGNYTITFANGVLTVSPAALTITADNKSKVYGDVNPTLTASYTGLKGTDTSSVVSGLNLNTAATTSSNAGAYTITAADGTSGNYTITHANGALTVSPAALTVTADNKSKVYGDANPALTASYSGLKGTDTSSVVSGLTLNTAATTSSNAGSYTITAADGTASNYTITFANGILTITAAPLLASTSSIPTILDIYQIMDTEKENITDIKSFNDTIVSAGTPNAELFTAKAVNYTIEQAVFGYQPPEPEDEDKKIERQKREQKIEKRK